MDRVRHVCASVTCATAEKYDADRLCAGCRSVFYCCPECQRADWKGHTPACRVATAEREASQIVRVGKGGGSAPPPAAPERVGPPASQWEAGAARGEAEALYNLGCCYDTGEGVPQSYERAAELWKQAAAKGHAKAQHNLGVLYRDGQGVPQSYDRAVELFQQAAEQGHASAQNSLGTLYHDGTGVPQSYERAAELWKQAAAQGNANAQYNLGILYLDGKGVTQSYERAAKLWKQAADQGHAGAQCNLGLQYRDGKGVPQSYERAVELYKQAADQGFANAQHNLGVLYYNGQGVPQDVARGVVLFKQAAAGGSRRRPTSCGRWARQCRRRCLVRQGHPNPWTDSARHRREGEGASSRAQLPPPAWGNECTLHGSSPKVRRSPHAPVDLVVSRRYEHCSRALRHRPGLQGGGGRRRGSPLSRARHPCGGGTCATVCRTH